MQMLARVPAQAIWEVIVSCELAFAFVDGLERCEVVEDSGETALVHQVVNQGWLVPTYDFVFESLRRHYRQIDVRLVEGNGATAPVLRRAAAYLGQANLPPK